MNIDVIALTNVQYIVRPCCVISPIFMLLIYCAYTEGLADSSRYYLEESVLGLSLRLRITILP